MEHLTKLFRVLELTRNQPQTGYVLAGIPTNELSNLAEHHYLVTFIAWQLARNLNRAGAKINVQKVLEYTLIHDLGELFGGDISMPYAKANRAAYRKAKAFEEENQKFLSKFFGKEANYFRKTSKEISDTKTDEGVVAKVADYIECTHYKFHQNKLVKEDLALALEKGHTYIKKIKDPITREQLGKFFKKWAKELPKSTALADIR